MAIARLLHTAVVFLLFVRASAATAPSPTVVDLGYARYQGILYPNLNITAFLGIRYAAPATRRLRFEAPVAPPYVVGIQQAFTDPLQCLQPAGAAASEDCLFLSVYFPTQDDKMLLPTIVWIYGGGYVIGSAGQFNGADLVWESNNQVVVVIIQYRLGMLGRDGCLFRLHDDHDFNLKDFSLVNKRKTVNLMLACSTRTLRCVRLIRTFGTPHLWSKNVLTISQIHKFGLYLMTLPPKQDTCNDTKPLDCLRAVDSATMADINANIVLGSTAPFTFVPVIDAVFITQSPTDALSQGQVNGDMLLSMTNTNEGPLLVNQTAEYDVAEYVSHLFPLFGANESNAAAAVYASFRSPLNQVNEIMGDECTSQGEYAISPALHGQDIINYFPSYTSYGAELIYNNTAFINAFTQGFLSFAVNLDLNDKLRPSITPMWQKWTSLNVVEGEMVFNQTEKGEPDIAPFNTSSALLERCAFWKSMRHLTAHHSAVVLKKKVCASATLHLNLSEMAIPAQCAFKKNDKSQIQVSTASESILQTLISEFAHFAEDYNVFCMTRTQFQLESDPCQFEILKSPIYLARPSSAGYLWATMPLYQLEIATALAISAFGSSVFIYLNRPTEGKIQLPIHTELDAGEDAFDVTKPEDIVDGYPIDGEAFWVKVASLALSIVAKEENTRLATHSLHVAFALYLFAVASFAVNRDTVEGNSESIWHLAALTATPALCMSFMAILPTDSVIASSAGQKYNTKNLILNIFKNMQIRYGLGCFY
ncbi:Alpha/Beta hydrolase protein [Mycena sanguinolenta]|nr:Alpha/Beta hydrolase protein [Mycena sanguinolenta]